MDKLVEFKENILKNISKVITGREKEIELLIVALLSGGHVLIEDTPGISKSIIAKAFSKTLNLSFNKIDFNPDLLPSDIAGANYYSPMSGEFQFKEGPIFSNIVLIDEIDKARPKIQALLFQVIDEGKQMTIYGLTRQLYTPHMVLATQNSANLCGAFPLPQTKLDKFFMRIKLRYLEEEGEKNITLKNSENKLKDLGPIIKRNKLLDIIESIKCIQIEDYVMDYLIDIVDITRKRNDTVLGISPRGSVDLYKAARAFAAINGRSFISIDDVRLMAPYVLNHRVTKDNLDGVGELTVFVEDLINDIEKPIYEN